MNHQFSRKGRYRKFSRQLSEEKSTENLMKKLFWSAFAMSLMILPFTCFGQTEAVDDFLGLETEILPDLEGKQQFTKENFHQKDSWNVSVEKTVIDLPEPIKGQGYSIIPWKTQDPEDFLSIKNWLIERKFKDATPDWKIRLRKAEYQELAGKVLQCRGECSVFRGTNKASVQHLSQIREGDEIVTGKDSVAWIFLMDGSLLRVSPETSLSVNEFNLGASEIFLLTRLNQGHVFWHPRIKAEYPLTLEPETDSQSIPLLVRLANQEFFDQMIYRNQSDSERMGALNDFEEPAIKKQIQMLNGLREENNKKIALKSRMMMVAPNATLVATNTGFDFYYLPGDKSYFKRRAGNEDAEMGLYLRGYSVTDRQDVTAENWYEVDSVGRNFTTSFEVPGSLQIIELLTKRIKTIELAREYWVNQFVVPYVASIGEPETLARNFGYSVWGEELNTRFNFLVEYTRRIETTNLRSIDNLLIKLEASGQKARKEISPEIYQASLNHYLLGLKNRYDRKKMRVKEFNDLQYYVWILRNGKF